MSPSGWFLLLLSLGFVVLVGFDWYARFARYHFEMQLFHLPSRADTIIQHASTGHVVRDLPARRGGDLSALVGLASAARRFEEEKPAGTLVLDEQGYATAPRPPEAQSDAVVIGDSFMAVGRMEDQFATRLATHSGLVVQNRAMMGHGPFVSVERFLADTHFRDHPPRFLVWGFAERELQGRFFQRLDFASDYYLHPDRYNFALEQQGDSALPTFFRVHWKSFQPAALKHSLPASSWLAQVSQWIWNRCRYRFFGRIHPDLVVSQADFGDGPLLFYRYHIESLALSTEERQANRVVEAIQKFDQLCRLRGMTLIVVLIPEKEQVYRDWIPANLQSADHPFPPPSLGPIAEALGQEGVLAVNLLPVFKNAMDRGQRVYWKDDTHWNPLGVDLAAAEVWRIMNQPQPQSRVSNP